MMTGWLKELAMEPKLSPDECSVVCMYLVVVEGQSPRLLPPSLKGRCDPLAALQ